jgi:hypothetical protein
MSPFEIIMLLCFSASWPFSIVRSWRARSAKGKSAIMLMALQLGYVAGILHKIFYKPDLVIILYILNLLMISADLVLYFRNKKIDDREDAKSQKTASLGL